MMTAGYPMHSFSDESDWGDSDGGAGPGDNPIDAAYLQGVINAQFARSLAVSSRRRPTRHRRGALSESANQLSGMHSGIRTGTVERSGRLTVRSLLLDALSTGGSASVLTAEKLREVVHSIECALKELPEDSAEIAHCLVVNLSDPLNTGLRSAVLSGKITPNALLAMDEESLLNPQLRAERQERRQERLEQQTTDFIEKMTSAVTFMYTCPGCCKNECFAQFRSADFVKWQGDDPTPTLLRCRHCGISFRA